MPQNENKELPVVILVTCGNKEEAETITNALVRRHLIACGNVIQGVTSIFQWEGKVTHDDEVLIIAKSRRHLIHDVVNAVKELHSYKTPEIIALPVIGGSVDYLDWLTASTEPGDDSE